MWVAPALLIGILILMWCLFLYVNSYGDKARTRMILLRSQANLVRLSNTLATYLRHEISNPVFKSSALIIITLLLLSGIRERTSMCLLCSIKPRYLVYFKKSLGVTENYWDQAFSLAHVAYSHLKADEYMGILKEITQEYYAMRKELLDADYSNE